jgi:hypothetical protein
VSLVQLNPNCWQNEYYFQHIMSIRKVTAIRAFGNRSLESQKMTFRKRGQLWVFWLPCKRFRLFSHGYHGSQVGLDLWSNKLRSDPLRSNRRTLSCFESLGSWGTPKSTSHADLEISEAGAFSSSTSSKLFASFARLRQVRRQLISRTVCQSKATVAQRDWSPKAGIARASSETSCCLICTMSSKFESSYH